MPAIEASHLNKRFAPAIAALQDVSLTVEPGQLCCLMGSNGAGKTTLLKIAAGLILPTSGAVRVDGLDLRRQAREARTRIGFACSEQPGLYDRLTGRQNLEFFAALYGLSGSSAAMRIDELLELLEIDAPHQRYQEYSAGLKQRVLLARALLHNPPVLLLDEPTRSLDPVQTAHVHALIRERLHDAKHKTILFSTHQVWEAERLAEQLVILHRGQIKASGPVETLTTRESLQALIQRVCR